MRTEILEFPTSNFYLAAYLLAHGKRIVNCERDSSRATFIFVDDGDVRRLTSEFTLGHEALVHAPAFVNAIKRLKSILYDGI